MTRFRSMFAAAALAAAAFSLPAAAPAQDYPSRPITLMVGYPPGGLSDLSARAIASAAGRTQMYVCSVDAAGVVSVSFIVALIVLHLITMWIADLVVDSKIGPLDRTLGFIFGVARGVIIAVVVVIFGTTTVELCEPRYKHLTNAHDWRDLDLLQVIRSGKAGMVAAQLALSAYQKRIADQLGVDPGAEMRAAIDGAHAKGLKLWLIGRNIGVTLRRGVHAAAWYQRWSLMMGLVATFLSRSSATRTWASSSARRCTATTSSRSPSSPTTIRRYESLCNIEAEPLVDGEVPLTAACMAEGMEEERQINLQMPSYEELRISYDGALGGAELIRCHLPEWAGYGAVHLRRCRCLPGEGRNRPRRRTARPRGDLRRQWRAASVARPDDPQRRGRQGCGCRR